jgi:hypothetical protein
LYYTEGVFLHEKANAGTYRQTIKLKAQPDPDCDQSQGFCEMWLPGNYTVKIGKLFSSSLFMPMIMLYTKKTVVLIKRRYQI